MVLGLAWRVLRFSLGFPLWGDEAFLCLNLADRNFAQLTLPLDLRQVATPLFLWIEKAAPLLLGVSERALRLFPLLAGIAALLLFRRLARACVGPAGAAIATGIFAVSYYLVRHTTEVKPYASDLLAAVALLLPAAFWLSVPRPRWLALLTVIVPIAIALSYPSVFVAAAVSVALLPYVVRLKDRRTWGWFLAYNLLLGAVFFTQYGLVGAPQHLLLGGGENRDWRATFPPSQPFPLLTWVAATHTGNLFAYPLGGRNGGSAATFLLSVAGAWHLGRTGRSPLLILLAAPFGWTLIAAAMHRYPYGGSARVALHLAPSICLLTAAGATALTRRFVRTSRARLRVLAVGAAFLGLVGLVGMGRDIARPYKTEADARVRAFAREIVSSSDDRDLIVFESSRRENVLPAFTWYLRPAAGRTLWGSSIDPQRLAAADQVWLLSFDGTPDAGSSFQSRLQAMGRRILRREHAVDDLRLGRSDEPPVRFAFWRWTLAPAD